MVNKKKSQDEKFKEDFLNTGINAIKQYKMGDFVKLNPQANFKEKDGYHGDPTFSNGEIIKVKPDDKYDINPVDPKGEILKDYDGKFLILIESMGDNS
ncbi:MAG: hypothetical protein H8E60_03910 [Candidatus Marinimicrobia bacterium]|nr:hypothetical protein [Candidatus Neomarinimicrobiota bacterium]